MVARVVGIAELMHALGESSVMTHEKAHKYYVQLVLLLVDHALAIILIRTKNETWNINNRWSTLLATWNWNEKHELLLVVGVLSTLTI